jgi:hypothetical protein
MISVSWLQVAQCISDFHLLRNDEEYLVFMTAAKEVSDV